MTIAIKNDNTYGDFYIEGCCFKTDLSLHTFVFISLFGGNVEADTPPQRRPAGIDNNDWFGNLFLKEENQEPFNSSYERALNNTVMISGNLKTYEAAALKDLAWMKRDKIASKIEATASIAGINKLKMDITLTEPTGTERQFQYIWDATRRALEAPEIIDNEQVFNYDVIDGGFSGTITADLIFAGDSSTAETDTITGGDSSI